VGEVFQRTGINRKNAKVQKKGDHRSFLQQII